MSVHERRDGNAREPASWTVAGFLAALSIAIGAIALVWYPGRVGPAAMLVALIAAGMGGPHQRLAGIAVAVTGVCWTLGMVVAVVFDQPIF